MPSSLVQGYRDELFCYSSQEAAGTLAPRVIFVSPYDCVIQAVTEAHTALGTDGGAVSLQVEKLTGTQALGAGATILGNNSNAGFNLKGAINTPQNGTFKLAASRRLKKGDRLAIRPAGVMTAVAGVCVTVLMNRKG